MIKQSKLGRGSFVTLLLVLSCVLVVSVLLAVTVGAVQLSFAQVYGVIVHGLFGVGDPTLYAQGKLVDVVFLIRLPRLVLAVAVGMALSVSGVIMQAVVKNPLAEPYVLGISSGASLGATLSIMLGVGVLFGENYVGVMACLGAFLISIGVVTIANIGGRATSVKLLLSGMALSALCGAASNFVIYFSKDNDALRSVTFWMMGSLGGAKWEQNMVILPVVVLGVLFFWSQSRTLNLMLLGDETAVTLGTDLHRYRQLYLLIAAILVGFAVYCAGVIGFVGLMVPHVVRMFFGTDHKRVIPVSALVGAIFLVWADVLCRVLIGGMELPLGVLTAMLGAPCFIYLMARKKYGFGGTA